MTKSSTALMSLVAAIPGAFLALLLVMAFLSHADNMGGMLNGVVGITLLCSVAAAVMPVGIMLFGGPAKPKAAKKKADGDGDSVVGLEEVGDDESASGVSDEYAASDDSSELLGDVDSSASSDMLERGDSDESGEMMDTYDDEQTGRHQVSDEWDDSDSELSDEFEFDDTLSADDLEFDFEDEEK